MKNNALNLKEYLSLSPTDRLNLFMQTLLLTNRTPDYYVNWKKVCRETRRYEIELNTLNYLVGKENIYEEAVFLFEQQPQLIKVLPSLLACRDKDLDVLSIEKKELTFYHLDFINIDVKNIKSYVDFANDSGLLDFLKSEINSSLVDYVYGVEVGLDSNGRKNRSGTVMEKIVESNVEKVAGILGFEHCPQATAKYILEKWHINVPVDKSFRRFDEAVFDPKNKRLWLIETNYYGGGGSKLKAVAGEFSSLNKLISDSSENIYFVWITDGQGWKTAHIPLLEAFGSINNIFNLNMLSKDYLLELLK